MSKAESLFAHDSAMTSVELSGVITMPFGKAMLSATCVAVPSGLTTAMVPGRKSSWPNRNPTLFT